MYLSGYKINYFSDCGIVIEAIIENLEIKQKVFSDQRDQKRFFLGWSNGAGPRLVVPFNKFLIKFLINLP